MAYAAWSVSFGEQPSAAKWNILGTNDASFNDGTGIAVSAITPEKLLTGTGTSWGWTSFTPSWTNLTVGSGTNTGYYKQIGKTVFMKVRFIYGAGSAVGSDPSVNLPVTANTNIIDDVITSDVQLVDSGTASYVGVGRMNTAGAKLDIFTFRINGGGVAAILGGITSTSPMTWTTNDVITISHVYEAA